MNANRARHRKTLNLIAAFAVSVFLSASGPAIHGQADDLVARLERAVALIRDNRIPEAEQQLAEILKVAPDAAAALNLLGTVRARQRRLDEAEALFTRAVRQDAAFVGARMNLVYLYLLKGAPAKSIVELREVLRLEPGNEDATNRLAALLLSERRFAECVLFIENLKLSQTVTPALLVVLGDAYSRKGDLEKAEDSYLQALGGRLENADALLGLAQVTQARGEGRNATILLSRIATLAANSTSPDFLYRFALTALKSNMADEAKSALERAARFRPDEPSFILALGIAWLRKSDLFEAEKLFRRLLVLKPDSPPAQLHLGYVLLSQKKYDEARQWLEKSARADASVPEVFYYLGLVAQEQNDDVRAVELFEKSIQKLPSYVHSRIALGASFMKLKNYPRAQQELELAAKLDPEEPKAHYNLALLYARLKDPKRAEAAMRIVENLKSKQAVPTADGVVVVPPPASQPH